MKKKEAYTKFFLSELSYTTSQKEIQKYLPVWWLNTREKQTGGLRLTDKGFDMLKSLDIQVHRIPFPKDMDVTPQIMLYLDHFIDCPYFFTKKEIYVTNERKAVELTLFSGDVRKYGIAKAMSRKNRTAQT